MGAKISHLFIGIYLSTQTDASIATMPALPPSPEPEAPLPTPVMPELEADDDDEEEDPDGDPMNVEGGNDVVHEDEANEAEVG